MRISEEKLNHIREEILAVIFKSSPNAMFTADVARNMARDEEFIKKLLIDLELRGLVASVKKNNNGASYIRRIRWRLTSPTFQAYQKVHSQNISYDENEHTFS